MRKLMALGLLLLTSSLLHGCATTSEGNFCDVASAIRPSVDDTLTPGTKTQILKHDTYGAAHCGWK